MDTSAWGDNSEVHAGREAAFTKKSDGPLGHHAQGRQGATSAQPKTVI